MRISSFANNLILVNNRLIGHERQCAMKFYRLRFSKERKGVLADRYNHQMIGENALHGNTTFHPHFHDSERSSLQKKGMNVMNNIHAIYTLIFFF